MDTKKYGLYNPADVQSGYFGEEKTTKTASERLAALGLSSFQTNEPKKTGIVLDTINKKESLGEDIPEEETGFIDKLKESASNAIQPLRDIGAKASEVGEAFKLESNADDGVIESGAKFLANLPGNTVQIAGDLISSISDPLGTASSIKELAGTTVEQGVNKIMATDVGQEALRTAGASEDTLEQIKNGGYFTTEERALLKDSIATELGRITNEPGRIKELLVENPADVLGTITGGLSIAKNAAKVKNMTGLADKLETLEKLTNPINIQTKAAELGTDIAKGGAEFVGQSVAKTTGVNYDTIKNIVKNPELFKQAETGVLTRESVADNIVSKVNTKMEEVSELGKEYENIRKGNIVADENDLSELFIDTTNKVKSNQLTKADNNIIKQASDYISGYRGDLTDVDLLSLRKQLDSVKYDPNTGLERKLSPQGNKVLAELRKKVDTLAKDKITGLKELDAKFAPEIKELQKIKKIMFDSQGDLKDNYISTIANITGNGKEVKLSRLEKLAPDLADQVKALKAVEDVELAKGQKVGSYMNAGSVGVGAITGGVPGAIAAYLITHPTTLVKVLKTYTGSKANISSILDKIKNGVKLTTAEAKITASVIKEQALENGDTLAESATNIN